MQMTVNRVLCLLAVDILGNKSFGVAVGGLIVNTTGEHETLLRGVYVTLHRMVDMGWLRSLRGSTTTSRPFYRLTRSGRVALDKQMKEFTDMGELYRRHRATRKR